MHLVGGRALPVDLDCGLLLPPSSAPLRRPLGVAHQAGDAGTAPRETAEEAKARVARQYEAARRELDKSARDLQRAHQQYDRAKDALGNAEAAAAKAASQHGELEEEMRRIWGGGGREDGSC